MQNMITTLWYAVSRTWAQQLLFLLLVPFSRIYSAIMRLRALGYRIGVLRQNRLPVPVLSVGNLVADGTA
ncbi:MAG: tetraacyldisaccharide 4'-kinase, partial [Trichlorobacter sp.]